MLPANTVSQFRAAVKQILAGLDTCRNLELVISSQGGAATMFASGDFAGSNADLDVDKLTAAITSVDAIQTLVEANGNAHLTNLNRMLS